MEPQGQFLKVSNESRNYTVRTATRADVTDIHRLIVELAAATGLERKVSSAPEDFLDHGFADHPAFHALLAERDGRVVGLSLYFFTFSSWRGEAGVYLQDLVVAESARGTGLGRRLIAETARAGMTRGATHLRLSVDAENENARRFYRRCGLEQSLDERIYQVDGEVFRKLGTSV